MNLLVAEDDILISKSLKSLLSLQGIKTDFVRTKKQLIINTRENTYDKVFTNVRLLDGDLNETDLNDIQGNQKCVVFMSAMPLNLFGDQAFLEKPFSKRDFLRFVKTDEIDS